MKGSFLGWRYNELIFFVGSLRTGFYGYKYLPSGVISFNYSETKDTSVVQEISYIPIALFLVMQFFSSLGVSTVPNMLVSEMFPFK